VKHTTAPQPLPSVCGSRSKKSSDRPECCTVLALIARFSAPRFLPR